MTDLLPLPLDHIGIAVNDIREATQRFVDLTKASILLDEFVPSQKVNVRFLELPNSKIELLEATSSDSPIAKFIAKRGEGIHHIAFRVSDIQAEMLRLRTHYQVLQEKPIIGAGNKLVFFIHPKSMGGTLVEICQPRQG